MQTHETLNASGIRLTPRNLFAVERASQGGFELIFADAQRREGIRATEAITPASNRNERRNPSESRTHGPEASRSAEQPRNTRRAGETRSSEGEPAHDDKGQSHAAVYEAASAEANAVCDIHNPIPEMEIINAVAEILQIQSDVLGIMLAQAELVPQDLTEPQNVTALLQQVYGAESPAALLGEPEFPVNYKAVNEAMVQLAEAAETPIEAVVTAQQTTATQTAATTQSEGTAVPIVEGLRYAERDGEIIVSDAPIEEETDAQAPRPSASAASASASTQTATAASASAESQPLLSAEGAPLIPAGEAFIDPAAVNVSPMENQVEDRVQSVQVTQQAQAAQNVDPADVINQIMSQIRVHTGEQVTEMRLTLRPESLGDIVLRVLTQNGIVTAQFIAESQRVREALESSFNQLRDALQDQGIQFSELSVSVRDDENERMNRFAQGRQNTRNRAASVESVEEAVATTTSIDFDATIDLSA
ncbi:MAG: flagellar hook-length control protein FliK [Defluviitaleaceae bacterium]|nr:flagellar hook-length control protein FliK [Defluviitaleaceae bacterium]